MSTFSLVCLLISFILYFLYVIIVYFKYSPDCISKSYYMLADKDSFTIWLTIVSLLIFPAWVEISPITFQFLPFLSVLSLLVVAIFPKYLESDRTVHIVAAIVSWILSLIWCLLIHQYIIPILLAVIVSILYFTRQNNILYWTESSAFLNIYISILLN